MLELTNRQLWEALNTSSDTQEGLEAAYLLEERGERSDRFFKKKEKLFKKRQKEIALAQEKGNQLLPKIASLFFIFSTLLIITALLYLLIIHELGYLLETPKFIFVGMTLLIVRGVLIYKASTEVKWPKYIILYTFLMAYGMLFVVGYPSVFQFLFMNDLYFGVLFLAHLLIESGAIFLAFKADK